MELSEIAKYVTDKVSSKDISLENYVTTDSLLQSKRGRQMAQNLPPVPCTLTKFKKGDVLVANIRPYLKKIWQADSEGGCSTDVLAFRACKGHSASFLYAVLMQNSFFAFMMQGSKGSKMPRGDKNQIMHYVVPSFTLKEENYIGNIVSNFESKIQLNSQINDNLPLLDHSLEVGVIRLAA